MIDSNITNDERGRTDEERVVCLRRRSFLKTSLATLAAASHALLAAGASEVRTLVLARAEG